MDFAEIARLRLAQLGLGSIEVVTRSPVKMERTYVRDLIDGRKKSVTADKLPALAEVLKLDLAALARGEMVPADTSPNGLATQAAIDEVARIMRAADEAGRDAILGRARALEIARRSHEQNPEEPADPRTEDDA